MTYLPLAILLTVGLIALTVFGERKTAQNPKILRILAVVNALLAVSGILIAAITHIIAQSSIADPSLEPDFASWAGSMYGIWYQISLPVLGVLFGITVLASLTALADKKQRSGVMQIMRAAVVCTASVVFLILAPFYGFMTENETIPLYRYILWSGAGMALTMRLACAVEYCGRIRKHVRKM